jgi:nitrate/nitrite transporter NarK
VSSTEAAQADQTSAGVTNPAPDEPDDGDGIGWGRAIASGLVILLVGFVGGVGGANLVLTKALGLSRNVRQYIATVLFLVVVIVLAWALRWLQGRRLI